MHDTFARSARPAGTIARRGRRRADRAAPWTPALIRQVGRALLSTLWLCLFSACSSSSGTDATDWVDLFVTLGGYAVLALALLFAFTQRSARRGGKRRHHQHSDSAFLHGHSHWHDTTSHRACRHDGHDHDGTRHHDHDSGSSGSNDWGGGDSGGGGGDGGGGGGGD